MQPSTLIIVSHAVRFDRIELHDKQFARKIRGNDYLFGAQTKKRTGKTLFLHSDPPQEKIRKEMNGSRRTITIGRKE